MRLPVKNLLKEDPVRTRILKRKEPPREVVVEGTVVTGVLRGSALIDLFYDRLQGILRIKPCKGTFDMKLDKPVRIEKFYTETLYHFLPHIGKIKTDLYIAPVTLFIKDGQYQCWEIRQGKSIYRDDILEVISVDNIREKFGLEDGNRLKVMLTKNMKRYKFDPMAFMRGSKQFIVRK